MGFYPIYHWGTPPCKRYIQLIHEMVGFYRDWCRIYVLLFHLFGDDYIQQLRVSRLGYLFGTTPVLVEYFTGGWDWCPDSWGFVSHHRNTYLLDMISASQLGDVKHWDINPNPCFSKVVIVFTCSIFLLEFSMQLPSINHVDLCIDDTSQPFFLRDSHWFLPKKWLVWPICRRKPQLMKYMYKTKNQR